MTIELVKIRAIITIGGTGSGLTVKTPYIQSFNVRKARGQASSFDASLKVPAKDLVSNNVGGEVTIQAGGNGKLNKIFTGMVKKASISPCWDDPGFVIFNISGVDALSLLQGKKYTRRCRATKGVWVSIDNVTRRGIRDGKFAYDTDVLSINAGDDYTKFPEAKLLDNLLKNTSTPPKTPAVVAAHVQITRITDSVNEESVV